MANKEWEYGKDQINYQIEYILEHNDLPLESLVEPLCESIAHAAQKKMLGDIKKHVQDNRDRNNFDWRCYLLEPEYWESLLKLFGIGEG